VLEGVNFKKKRFTAWGANRKNWGVDRHAGIETQEIIY